jgi:soluble cytochrome b562
MPVKPKRVSTAADELLRLVTQIGEISLKDAAARLHVPIQTVEAWATFLEEDGMLGLKYKLTTPYLVRPQKKKLEEAGKARVLRGKLDMVEAKNDFVSAQELLSSIAEKQHEGEFGKLQQMYGQLIAKLNSTYEYLATREELDLQTKNALRGTLAAIQKTIESAQKAVSDGKFDLANSIYSQMEEQLNQAVQNIKTSYTRVTKSKELNERGIKELIGEAYASLQSGNLEEAQQAYARLNRMRATLSQSFFSKKNQLEESILKLNKDMSLASHHIMEQRASGLTQSISRALALAIAQVKARNYSVAASQYAAIKKSFSEFPPGFEKQKKMLQARIIALYEHLTVEREKRLSHSFSERGTEVDAAFREADKLLKAGNLALAISAYRKMMAAYANLPPGFLKQKTALQNKIAPLHAALSRYYEANAEIKLGKITQHIRMQLTRMQELLARENLAEARNTYNQLSSVFKSLPDGFLREETGLQVEALNAYERLLAKENVAQHKTLKSADSSVHELLKKTEVALQNGALEQAEALYQQAKRAYTRIPSSDAGQRLAIRNQLLTLYRQLLMSKSQLMQARAVPEIHSRIQELNQASRAQVKIPVSIQR